MLPLNVPKFQPSDRRLGFCSGLFLSLGIGLGFTDFASLLKTLDYKALGL